MLYCSGNIGKSTVECTVRYTALWDKQWKSRRSCLEKFAYGGPEGNSFYTVLIHAQSHGGTELNKSFNTNLIT